MWLLIVFLVSALLTGSISVFHQGLNAALSMQIQMPLFSAMVSRSIGLSMLLILRPIEHFLFTPDNSLTSIYLPVQPVRVMMLVPGIIATVSVSNFLTPYIGFAVYIVCYVSGQLIMSFFIDHFGWWNNKVYPFSALTALSLILTWAGMCLAMAEKLPSDISIGVAVGFGFVVLAMGALTTVQTAMVGQMAPAFSTKINFSLFVYVIAVVGAGVLVIATLPVYLPAFAALPNVKVPWWMFFGDVCGAFLLVFSSIVSRRIGFGLFYTCLVTGQLVTAVLVDHFNLLGVLQLSASLLRILGVCLALVAVVLCVVEKFSEAVEAAKGLEEEEAKYQSAYAPVVQDDGIQEVEKENA